MSRDHDWGNRLTLLVDQADAAAVPAVRDRLAAQLPGSWRDRPVRFATTWQGAGGIGGFFEKTFAPRAMRAIYDDELQRLDAYAREQQTA